MKETLQFKKLFEPLYIGKMKLRNRIVMAPMATDYATVDGFVTEQLKDYYEARAKGGAGLIIIEATCVDFPEGRGLIRELRVDDDSYIRGLGELAQAIQRHGARATLQLLHAGREAKKFITHIQPVAPSPIPSPGGDQPRELTIREIQVIVERFAKAAERAKRAGFDAVEIHGAHHYLFAQFLSRAANRRQDAYGGSLQNRARILIEVIRAIRGSVGGDYPILCRINSEDRVGDGIAAEEMREVAPMIQGAGADAIHVSGWPPGIVRFPPMAEPPGNLLPLAEGVKKVVTIPVIGVGRITPEVGEQAIRENRVDLVAIGKALIADPDLPNKVASGRLNDIIPCIGDLHCHRTAADWLNPDRHLHCTVNAMTGREREYALSPAKKGKNVMVVGGGPAGMEAASVAALRGHRVTLYEKSGRLGGQLLLAALPPYKDRINTLTEYLERRLRQLAIDVQLHREVTSRLVADLKPDVVVIATGGSPSAPKIPGIDRSSVVFATDVLSGRATTGSKIVVIGGGLVGCETAEFLAEKGRKVTIVEMLEEMAVEFTSLVRMPLLQRLASKGIDMLTSAICEEITNKGVTVTKEGKRQNLEADTIVLATGMTANRELVEQLRGKVPEIYAIGDCVEPRRIPEAIADGARVGRAI